MRELVFVHGRSQQRLDPGGLKRLWVESWAKGLEKNGLSVPLADNFIRFPYYGDTLDGLVHGASAEEAAEVIIRGDGLGDDEKGFAREYLTEVLKKAGVSDAQVRAGTSTDVIQKGPLNWGWVRAIARAIDRNVPGGSGASVALFTNDVYQYLTNPGIRDEVDTGVIKALPPRTPVVVVAHSLGTVVAFNLLRREGDSNHWDVSFFATLGSPLGVNVIRQRLSPIRHPKCVSSWFNAMDPNDIVALYPLDVDHFDTHPAITNKQDVANPTQNKHGIDGYLSDPEVAKRIYDAVMANP